MISVTGNHKSSNIDSHKDQYDRVVYDRQDLYDMLFDGHDISPIKELSWHEDFDKYNQALVDNHIDANKLKPIEKLSMDVPEFDRLNQKTWFIPDEYMKIDVKSYIFDRTPEHALERVNMEWDLYDKYQLIDVLKACIFIIDTFREKGIVWGVGRGSSVASYILYVLGVHKVDSIKYNLDINEFLK